MKKGTAYFILALLTMVSCRESGSREIKSEEHTETVHTVSKQYDSFGFRVDTLQVQSHKITRNESLYLILDQYNFTPEEIHTITEKAGEVIDFRSFKPGQRYYTYSPASSPENSGDISRLVWQPSLLEYVVFDLADTLDIYRSRKEIVKRKAHASEVIERSLYETIKKHALSPMLGYKLSDIYAWEIDFFRLREGDRFKVVYEEHYVDDSFYEIGDILAVEFNYRGESHFAYKFEDERISGYFTGEGKSLRKALLKAPFEYGQRISSRFSHSRFHPVLKRRMPHHGVDYAAPYGTPVLAVGDGRIIEAGYRGAGGNTVKIRHNGTYKTAYLHLKGFARGIKEGVQVSQGQVIGYVGKTGRVTGTHLDYRIYKNERPVNPLELDLPASESVPEASMEMFERVKKYWNKHLAKIEYSRPIADKPEANRQAPSTD